MKIFSDIITRPQLYAALPPGVYVSGLIEQLRPRRADYAYTITLDAPASNRPGNSGSYGAASRGAPTWDQYGLFIAALFEIDPDASIANYDGIDAFIESTTRTRDYYATATKKDGTPTQFATEHRAPWLT